MEMIGKQAIYSFLSGVNKNQVATNNTIRHDAGHAATNYLDLAKKIAELQFYNPNVTFLFRGQAKDWKNHKSNSTLKPSIFRSKVAGKHSLPPVILTNRFIRLNKAEDLLVSEYSKNSAFTGQKKLQRQRILRWAILQHYEICATPLLDVPQSLRVALSFANEPKSDQGFLFVLAVPNLNGALTASMEAGLQIAKLSAACPPIAIRPHIQEGFLIGEYPDIPDFNQRQYYPAYEIDCARRLIAKFTFNPQDFWKLADFSCLPANALYPDAHDPMFEVAERIIDELNYLLGPEE